VCMNLLGCQVHAYPGDEPWTAPRPSAPQRTAGPNLISAGRGRLPHTEALPPGDLQRLGRRICHCRVCASTNNPPSGRPARQHHGSLPLVRHSLRCRPPAGPSELSRRGTSRSTASAPRPDANLATTTCSMSRCAARSIRATAWYCDLPCCQQLVNKSGGGALRSHLPQQGCGPFAACVPTAENIALHIADLLTAADAAGGPACIVRLQESPNNAAEVFARSAASGDAAHCRWEPFAARRAHGPWLRLVFGQPRRPTAVPRVAAQPSSGGEVIARCGRRPWRAWPMAA